MNALQTLPSCRTDESPPDHAAPVALAALAETPPTVRLVTYRTLAGLRGGWEALDRAEGAFGLTVILVLGDDFGGYLPDVIRRRHRAGRLAITAPSGHLPGFVTAGDLAMTAGALGWLQIVFLREMREDLAEAVQSLSPGERCVIFWPDHLDRPDWRQIIPADWPTNDTEHEPAR
jgi:hypothetical protein